LNVIRSNLMNFKMHANPTDIEPSQKPIEELPREATKAVAAVKTKSARILKVSPKSKTINKQKSIKIQIHV